MKDSSLETLNKEFHPHADEVAQEYIAEFTALLLRQAKLLAFQENADLVLSNHVADARQIISRERHKRWTRELWIALGSTLFGAFISGFITELSAGHRLLIAVYPMMGLIGTALVFWGLRR